MSTTVELVAGDSDTYAVLHVTAPAGAALPPHVCSNESCTLVVLSGEIEAVLAGERRLLGPGDCMNLPRAQPRRLCAISEARVLCVSVPAGVERLLDLFGPSAPDPDDRAALLTAAGVALLPAGWGAPPG